MESILLYTIPLFFVTSLVYATTGLGGGAGYIALLALFSFPHDSIPPISLACGAAATAGVSYHFHKKGYLKIQLALPFLIGSIPASFIGGTLAIPETPFNIALVIILIFIALRTLFWKIEDDGMERPSIKKAYLLGIPIGIVIGLTSGIIGVGGGVLLMPFILLLRWGSVREAGAAGGLFTLVNSLSGLIGHGTKEMVEWPILIPLVLTVIVGSQIGAYLGAKKLSESITQKIFAILLLSVATKITVNLIW